jgi:hypothetical protein
MTSSLSFAANQPLMLDHRSSDAVPIYKPFATQLVLRPHARLRQATLPRG